MSLRIQISICFLALTVLACKDSSKFSGSNAKSTPPPPGPNIESFQGAQRVAYPVDIIFAIDASESMKSSIQSVSNQVSTLITTFLDKNQQFDYHIYFLFDSSNEKVGWIKNVPFGPKVVLVTKGCGGNNCWVGSKNALSRVLDFLGGISSSDEAPMRVQSVKEVVVVTDDNSQISKAKFIEGLDQIGEAAKEVHISAVVTAKGTVYRELADEPRTVGIKENLGGDWSQIMNRLGTQISTLKIQASIYLQLKGIPQDPSKPIIVRINGVQLPQEKVRYEAATNKVFIDHPTQDTDKIEVQY